MFRSETSQRGVCATILLQGILLHIKKNIISFVARENTWQEKYTQGGQIMSYLQCYFFAICHPQLTRLKFVWYVKNICSDIKCIFAVDFDKNMLSYFNIFRTLHSEQNKRAMHTPINHILTVRYNFIWSSTICTSVYFVLLVELSNYELFFFS